MFHKPASLPTFSETIRTIVLALLCLCLTTSRANATAQAADTLLLDGTAHALFTNPLESFFAQHPEKRPQCCATASSLHRGYIATFEIRDELLTVSDVEVRQFSPEANDLVRISVYQSVFGSTNGVVADWFDGLLVVPIGNQLKYIHMGYASIYERYLLIQVKKGRIIKQKEMGSEEYGHFRLSQFEEYKRSPHFEIAMKELDGNGSGNRESHEAFLYLFETEYISKYLLDF